MSPANPVDSAQMRRLNAQSVLHELRAAASPTLTQLARRTGLSRHTVSAVLRDLSSRGLAEELAPAEGSSGRPARRYRFRGAAGHVAGFGFAPDHVVATVCDLDGTEIARERRDVDPTTPAVDRLRLAEELGQRCAARVGPVWAAAAGTTGVVDPDGKVRVAHQIPGWTGLDLASRVGSWFDCPGFAGNDAHLAALAEKWRGNARDARDVAHLLTGHRSGFGVVIGGRLHIGRTGAAGEFGKLKHILANDPTDLLAAEGITADELFARVHAGDDHAVQVADRVAFGLAQCAAVLVMAIDPELVVLGGYLAQDNQLLLDQVRRHLRDMCVSPPEVVPSALGEEAVALGAVRMALDCVEASALLFGPRSEGTVAAAG